MMKNKIFSTFCLGLALAVLLASCGKKENAPSGSTSSAVSQSTQSAQSSIASSSLGKEASGEKEADKSTSAKASENEKPASLAAPAQVLPTQLEQLATGGFACLDENELYPDERAPMLEILKDNSATFRLNTGNEIATVKGLVRFEGTELTFLIKDMGTQADFWGSNLTSLSFLVLNQDKLEYTGGPFGLTRRQDVFARDGQAQPGAGVILQGSGPALPAPPSLPQPVQSGQTVSSGAKDNSGQQPAASGSAASMPQIAPLTDDEAKIPVVEQDKEPPKQMRPGDSLLLDGVPLEELVYNAVYFKAVPTSNGQGVIVTALMQGETSLTFSTQEGELAGKSRTYPITILEKSVKVWFAVAIAVLAAVFGGGAAIGLFLFFKKRKDTKEQRLLDNARKKEEKAAAALVKKEQNQEKAAQNKEKRANAKQQRQEKAAKVKAKWVEKKAAFAAKGKEKKARNAAKKAAKAAEEAEKAVEKATKAAEKISGGAQKKSEDETEK